MSNYPLIADHGLIGNLQTAALSQHRRHYRLVLRPALRLAEHLRLAYWTMIRAATSGFDPRSMSSIDSSSTIRTLPSSSRVS